MYDFENRRILDLKQFDIETDYHFEMCEKYKFAADHPWLPVLPDPPPPQRSPRGEFPLDPFMLHINPAKTKTPTYDAFRRRLAALGVIPAVGIE